MDLSYIFHFFRMYVLDRQTDRQLSSDRPAFNAAQ